MMPRPFVSATVQFRAANIHGLRNGEEWHAAVVTKVRPDRMQTANTSSGWIEAVDLAVFQPGGGIRVMRMVGRFREGAGEEEQREEDVWRWAPELFGART